MSAWTIFVLVMGYIFLAVIVGTVGFLSGGAFVKWIFDCIDERKYKKEKQK